MSPAAPRTFDPSQALALAYDGPGPVVVRGRAGVGRTTVLVARVAASLAQPALVPRRILVLTPHAAAVAGLRTAITARLGRDTTDLEVRTVDSLCADVLDRAGRPLERLSEVEASGFMADALAAVRRRDARPVLSRSDAFFASEIGEVIKGRALGLREEYLSLDREGRWRGLEASVRESVWAVYQEYERRLHAAGASDAEGLSIHALGAVGAGGEIQVDAVYVDDAHALPKAALQLCRAVARPSDHIWIFTDDSQRYFRQGFTLKEAGIEARRSFELEHDWRRSESLRRFCDALAQDDPTGKASTIVPRSDDVRVEAAADFVSQFPAAMEIVRGLFAEGVAPTEIAVVTRFDRNVRLIGRAATDAGLSTVRAGALATNPGSHVVMGTVDEIRGLEFEAVVIVDASRGAFPSDDGGQDPSVVFRDRRRLFVAASRARSRIALVHQEGLASPFLPTFV